MSKPVSLARHRWDNGDGKPGSHSVRECLEVMLAKLNAGEIEADHVVIAHGRIREDGAVNDGYMQAGKLDPYGQIGLLYRVCFLLGTGE